MSMLLFAITATIVVVIGVVAYFTSDDGGILYQIWASLMYTLDAGNLAGVPTDNVFYLLLMFLATLCGLFLTSVLVGIVATGVEGRLSDLRKGSSVVQEENHTVIVGFDKNIFSILRELIEANANKKKACIVVLGKMPKEKMEEAIAAQITDTKTTQIICRNGNLHESYAFERCSVESAKVVIINVFDDSETVKILLGLASYVKDKKLTNPDLRFIASLQDKQYVEAADIAGGEIRAGEKRASNLFVKDAIARIISNTCRQHGLSQVLTELFNFSGHELYFEHVRALEGKSFKEATLSFSNAVVMGLYSNGQVKLNPPMDTVIGKDDMVVLLEKDDGDYVYHSAKTGDEASICNGASSAAKANNNLLVLGSNEKLPIILEEYSKYVEGGARVVIVDDDLNKEALGTHGKLEISVCTEPVNRSLLCRYLNDDINNVLILNDDSLDAEASDSQTLLRLILLRNIADNEDLHLAITTEMRSVDNQRLASQARVDDFVIGSNFASLMMAQISENPKMKPLIDDLLDESGSELYMKPASDYVKVGVPVDSYTVTESAARKGEIYLGYRHFGKTKTKVIVNPRKDELITFGESDQIVVVAEN